MLHHAGVFNEGFAPLRRYGLIFFFVAMPMLTNVAEARWPGVPLPPHSQGEVVTKHMKNNGFDMRVSVFSTSLRMEEVIAFYREKWGEDMAETEFGENIILAVPIGMHFVSVDLSRGSGGTQGTIGITKMPERPVNYEPGGGVVKPAGTQVFSDVRYLDLSGEPRVLTMFNELTPYANQQFYYRHLAAKGWKIDHNGGEFCTRAARRCITQFAHPRRGQIMMYAGRESFDGQSVTQVILHIH